MEREGCMDDWELAQAIDLSIDLIEAAKEELQFLAEVDAQPALYHNHQVISLAIYRYENFWLPLLASHGSLASPNLPYVPPLDCAWIWHCHRLNPLQYAEDCNTLHGKLIDCVFPYVFNLDEAAREDATKATENIWDHLYPKEKYLLDLNQFSFSSSFADVNGSSFLPCEHKSAYNLKASISRQQCFFYQVSEPYMKDESYLKMAMQRYKGFLYLRKKTWLTEGILVPTYDIDVMWHAHIRSPVAYRKDTMEFYGKVLSHDDSINDRTPGLKLMTGYHRTIQLWEDTFGTMYHRSGVTYRGEPPSHDTIPLSPSLISALDIGPLESQSLKKYLIPRKTMNVYLSIIGARNVPLKKKGEFFVCVKVQNKSSSFKLETPGLPSTSDPEWRNFWSLICELGTEGLFLELWLRPQSFLGRIVGGSVSIGSIVMSWQSILASPTLSLEGWVSLKNESHLSKVPELRVSVTITPPTNAPFLLRSVISSLICGDAKFSVDKQWMLQSRSILDHEGREIFIVSFSASDVDKSERTIQVHVHPSECSTSNACRFSPGKEIDCARQVARDSSKASIKWILLGDSLYLNVIGRPKDLETHSGLTFELTGNIGYPARLILGRKLQYEVRGAKMDDEVGFVSLVRYTPDSPLGKATALLNWNSGEMQVSPEENVIMIVLILNVVSISVLDIYGSKNPFKKGNFYSKWRRENHCLDD